MAWAYQKRQGRLGFLDLSNRKAEHTQVHISSRRICMLTKAGEDGWEKEYGVNYKSMENTVFSLLLFYLLDVLYFPGQIFFCSFNSHLLF